MSALQVGEDCKSRGGNTVQKSVNMEGVKFDGVILFYDLILHQFMPNMEVNNIKEAIL